MINSKFGILIDSSKITEKPIISSKFTMTMDHYLYQNIHATLYNEFIIIESKKNSHSFKIIFDFDLIFDIHPFSLKKKSSSTEITLIKSSHWIQFQNNSDSEELQIWRVHLTKRLNQRGFHEKYRPIKKLGSGNFASVYLVQRLNDGKNFAAKAFLKQTAYHQQKGKQAVINQITIMRKLEHRNLVKLEQVFQTENSIYLISQLIQGGQLSNRMKVQQKLLDMNEIKMIMKCILQGLCYMHQKHIMHRDLKPQNILFRNYFDNNQKLQWVIGDFGLAQDRDNKQYIFTRCGTPGFVAPEVVNIKDQKTQKYDEKCDIFSIGIIFHMLLLRRSPFIGSKFNDILLQNRICNLDFTKRQYGRLTKQSLNFLMALLQKNPKNRLTASEALHHPYFFQENHQKKGFSQTFENINEQALDERLSADFNEVSILSCNEYQRQKKQILITCQDSLGEFQMAEDFFKHKTNEEISSKSSFKSSHLTKINKQNKQSKFRS